MAQAAQIENLDCEADVVATAQAVLTKRLEEMCALRDAALDPTNAEGVHDMRVASRRLRSALRDFEPFLSKRQARSLGKSIKVIADALGTVRDEDVATAALESLAAEAPADIAVGIKGFIEERSTSRETARAQLADSIKARALAKVRAEFAAELERAGGSSSRQAKTLKIAGKYREADSADNTDSADGTSFRQAGQAIILARLRELRDLSSSLYHPFEVEPLHRLRIRAKRLRYAVELFATCWDDEAALSCFAKEVAWLQSSLGEVHDCDEWITAFGVYLHKQIPSPVSHSGSASSVAVNEFDEQKRRAAVWLLRYFVKMRAKHYSQAVARWHDVWEADDFTRRLTSTLSANMTSSKLDPAASLHQSVITRLRAYAPSSH